MKPERIVDRKLLDTYHQMPCLVCSRRPSDPAHIRSRGAGGDDVPWNLAPLCRVHHTEQHQLGWKKMSEKNFIVSIYLWKQGWRFDSDNKLRRDKDFE